jgi:DNA-binding CsgD family transcriptional regulator
VLQITPLERRALQLLAQGPSAREIAICLGIPVSDVDAHLSALFARMRVASRADAIADAARRGLLFTDAPDRRVPRALSHVSRAVDSDASRSST